MLGFITFILKGRIQAIVIAAMAAVMSMVLPPLSHVSGAVVALVTLRNGASAGALVGVGAGLVLLILGFVASVESSVVNFYVLSMVCAVWIPVLIGALILRNWRSLSLSLTAVSLLALVMMLVFYMVIGDVKAWWYTILESVFSVMLQSQAMQLTSFEIEQWLNNFAAIMTGVVSAAMLYTMMINLSLARWWQALKFNPGGFRQEFHGLKLDKRIAAVALPFAVLSSLGTGAFQAFGQDAMVLIMALFSLSGLALVHAVVAFKKLPKAMLAIMYLMAVFLLPQIVVVLAAAGLTDSWLDFRRRLGMSV